MNKSRRHRQRRHNGKLSRRMKKRGGTKSSLKTAQSTSNRHNVRISPIVAKDLVGRASFFERVKVNPKLYNKPTTYTRKGPNTIFTIHTPAGLTQFTVDTKLDEEEQHKAYDIFNYKFRTIQYFIINKLRSGDDIVLHDGQWMCVKAGYGIWHPSGKHEGSWTMLPEKVNCDINVTDAFVRSEDGKQWISEQNDKHIFCVPENYRSIMTLHELGAAGAVGIS